MLGLLEDILCAIENMAAAIVNLLIFSINGLILLLGVTVEAVVELLPDMPGTVEAPDSGVLHLVNWLVPVGPLIGFCTTALVLWAGVMAVKLVLTYLRAL